MNKFKRGIKKALFSYRALPDKKQYVEFFTALLTVPMLLTVIVLNFNNLSGANKKAEPKENSPIIVTLPPSNNEDENDITPEPTSEVCKDGIGPISIVYPEENETVTDNPVTIDIDYDDSEYCAVVWSYRINGGRYSDYGSNNIALYNPPQGTVRLELRVKSVVSGDEKTLRRTFTYEGTTGSNNDPSASTSAN